MKLFTYLLTENKLEKINLWVMREGNVLFNNTLITFYLWLDGIGCMVKDHSENERANPLLPPHRLFFPISSSVLLYVSDSIAHTTVFVILVMEHWLE